MQTTLNYGSGFQSFTGFEYLCIDIANYYGMDKENFEPRIQWVKDNFTKLEEFTAKADTPEMYAKSVMSLRRACRGEAIGHVVYWDGVCSGIQIMSALTGCRQGAYNTGLIDPDKRMDAYGNCTTTMNGLLTEKGLSTFTIPRGKIKDAFMTAGYGSKAVPKRTFGEDLLPVFNESTHIIAPGAFKLMDELLASWQAYALDHSWTMPDGFNVKIKVVATKETRVEVDELDHATFTLEYKVNEGSERGLSNVANTTHSCDAYLLRTLDRRCNYDKYVVLTARQMLEARLLAHSTGLRTEAPTEVLSEAIDRWNKSQMADTVVFDLLAWDNYMQLPIELACKLMRIANAMLTYEPFQILTVHDAFGSHAGNCNEVRYWYKEILAEFAESTLLEWIMNQIYGIQNGKYKKLSDNLAEEIRGSNYGLS